MSFEKQVQERKMLLLQQLEWIQREKKEAPPGILRATKHGDGYQFYIRKDKQDHNGVYLPKNKISIAKQMAQQEYLDRQEQLIRKELHLLEKLERIGVTDPWTRAAQEMSEGKSYLLEKNRLSDEEYALWWSNQSYDIMPIREDAPAFYTDKNELVRSKSEVIIANALFRAGVPYHYEQPLFIPRMGEIHPDFTVLRQVDRKEILWEHLGMMDDSDYRSNALQRLKAYEASGYYLGCNLVVTFETTKQPLDTRTVNNLIKQFFVEF